MKYFVLPLFKDDIPQQFKLLRSIICYSNFNNMGHYNNIILNID